METPREFSRLDPTRKGGFINLTEGLCGVDCCIFVSDEVLRCKRKIHSAEFLTFACN